MSKVIKTLWLQPFMDGKSIAVFVLFSPFLSKNSLPSTENRFLLGLRLMVLMNQGMQHY